MKKAGQEAGEIVIQGEDITVRSSKKELVDFGVKYNVP